MRELLPLIFWTFLAGCVHVCVDALPSSPLGQNRTHDVTATPQGTAPTVPTPEGCHKYPEMCLTRECLQISSDVINKMDQKLDPCDNFFKFACGRWMEENSHQVFGGDILYTSNLNEMPKVIDTILEDLITTKRRLDSTFYQSKPFKDLSQFFKSCMDEETLEKEGFEPVFRFLETLKEFQIRKPFQQDKWNLTKALLELARHNGYPLFYISIDISLKNSSEWVPVVSISKHYGIIPSELVGGNYDKKTMVTDKYMLLRLKSLVQKLQNILGNKNYKRVVLEEMSKIDKYEARNKVLKVLKGHQALNQNLKPNNQHGKPTKFTSFFSRLIGTGSVSDGNMLDFSSFKEDEQKNKLKLLNEIENRFDSFDYSDYLTSTETFPLANTEETNDINQTEETENNDNLYITLYPALEALANTSSTSNDTHTKVIAKLNITNQYMGIGNKVHHNMTMEEAQSYMESLGHIYNSGDWQNSNDFSQLHNSSGYQLLLEEAEFAFELLKEFGLAPDVTREDLYEGITKEVENTTLFLIREMVQTLQQEGILRKGEENYNYSYDVYENTEDIMTFVKILRDLEPTAREKVILVEMEDLFQTVTLKELQRQMPIIEWKYLFSELLNHTLSDDTEVLIPYYDYVGNMFQFVSQQNMNILHDSLLILYSEYVLKELISGAQEMTRDEFCLEVTKETMNYPLSYMYLKYLGDDTLSNLRKEVDPIIKALMKTAKSEMDNSDFFSEKDKMLAIQKLDKMKWEIGGMDQLYNLTFIEDAHKDTNIKDQHFLWNMMDIYKLIGQRAQKTYGQAISDKQIWSLTTQPYTINAFYVQYLNTIVIPEAFFNRPYYYEGAPKYFTFGSAGMAFAHEAMHGFDMTGIRFDHTGTFTSPFSNELKNRLKKKIDCFNDMVTKLFSQVEDIEGFNIMMNVDNNATINENLADVVGLDFAYKAYLDYAKSLEKEEPILPGLPFTREQLFFIGFAQPYCAIVPPVAKMVVMEVDEHLVHDIRINSVLLNYPQFAKTFQCEPHQKMTSGSIMPTCPIF